MEDDELRIDDDALDVDASLSLATASRGIKRLKLMSTDSFATNPGRELDVEMTEEAAAEESARMQADETLAGADGAASNAATAHANTATAAAAVPTDAGPCLPEFNAGRFAEQLMYQSYFSPG